MNETRRGDILEGDQNTLRGSYEQIVRQLQDILSTDKKLIVELEHIKSRISEVPERRQGIEGLPKPANLTTVISEGDVLATLTPTERSTLQILRVEGAKGAPELGTRLKKSREHTSRLMKKLYMEGYVSRESNRAPFRYKLNDVVRSALESAASPITEEQTETP
jgi:DNA-binding MarR family transcriptional regulator